MVDRNSCLSMIKAQFHSAKLNAELMRETAMDFMNQQKPDEFAQAGMELVEMDVNYAKEEVIRWEKIYEFCSKNMPEIISS